VRSLKIKHNNVLGWFIETTAPTPKADRRPGRFIHRQTMAGAMRFTTPALADLESRIANAPGEALAIELAAFDGCAMARASRRDQGAARTVSVSMCRGLAELAEEDNGARPRR
jgi:DNA mismatch repair protein MutS